DGSGRSYDGHEARDDRRSMDMPVIANSDRADDRGSVAMRNSTAGFTLIEILVTLLLVSLTMTGVVTVAALHHKTYLQEDVRVGIADSVRIGLDTLTDTLRNGLYGYGAPTIAGVAIPSATRLTAGNLASWITWVPGFTSNPLVT